MSFGQRRAHRGGPRLPTARPGIKVYTDEGRKTLDWLEAISYLPDLLTLCMLQFGIPASQAGIGSTKGEAGGVTLFEPSQLN